jgi:hypothetical protein
MTTVISLFNKYKVWVELFSPARAGVFNEAPYPFLRYADP